MFLVQLEYLEINLSLSISYNEHILMANVYKLFKWQIPIVVINIKEFNNIIPVLQVFSESSLTYLPSGGQSFKIVEIATLCP